jgi:uncharacterized RmlC-like cupin family protein
MVKLRHLQGRTIPPDGVASAHIHVDFEPILYTAEGTVRREFGPGLKQVVENEPRDSTYIKPGVPMKSSMSPPFASSAHALSPVLRTRSPVPRRAMRLGEAKFAFCGSIHRGELKLRADEIFSQLLNIH